MQRESPSGDSDPVYLDYAATTPVDARVAARMQAHMTAGGVFANPSSTHGPGLRARDAVEAARADVARVIGAKPQEIVWTSGAYDFWASILSA